MANLSITAADVRLVRGDNEHQHTAPAGEAITAGQYVRLNTSTGKFELGNGTTSGEVGNKGFVAGRTVAADETLTAYGGDALLDVGDALDALNFGAVVYLSDTDGTLADSAGTVSKTVGVVTSGWAATTADKLLQLTM